ncbi:MAG: hypothetical protein MJ181_04710 [Treponema sp.]|nr:hypothetical protein [Treponema sp.]
MSKIFDKFYMMLLSFAFVLLGLSIIVLNLITKTASLTGFAIVFIILGVIAGLICFLGYNKKRTEYSKSE